MNGTAITLKYYEVYSEHEKRRYRDFLLSLSDDIRFDDDIWICLKRLRGAHETPCNVSIYFTNTPAEYKYMTKYYAILLLIQGKSVSSVHREVYSVNHFLRFMEDDDICKINVLTASRFKEYLDSKGIAEATRAKAWSDAGRFLTLMNGYDDMTLKNPLGDNIYQYERLHDNKYIAEHIAKQLDRAFKNGKIPLHIRCVYWLLRLIPSRISEILGMNIDCVKPFDGHFCIFIPTWKQSGGYREPIMRVIHVNDKGMGGYLLALLREQQKTSLIYQEYINDGKKGSLFTYRRQKKNTAINRYSVATRICISNNFKKICGDYGIKDEYGDNYCVASHQFRHNGITDRLRAGFTLPQIAEMTGHHGTAMIYASYAHMNLFPETLIEPNLYENQSQDDEKPYILFGGKILNMDAVNESRLLRNLRAHRVPGGICSDVTRCESGMWGCLSCEQFIPEKEQLPYFEEQVSAWKEKAELFKRDVLMRTNYMDIAKRFEVIVTKIKREDGQDNE
jgi:integrase